MINHTRGSQVYLPRRSIRGAREAGGEQINHEVALSQALAERIGSLPGISCEPAADFGWAALRRYFLDAEFTLGHDTDIPFGTLDTAGRISLRVGRADRDEIVRAGWAEVDGERIVTFPPRDAMDVTVLWRIVLMAYFHAAERRDPNAWQQIRPRPNPDFQNGASSRVTRGAFF